MRCNVCGNQIEDGDEHRIYVGYICHGCWKKGHDEDRASRWWTRFYLRFFFLIFMVAFGIAVYWVVTYEPPKKDFDPEAGIPKVPVRARDWGK